MYYLTEGFPINGNPVILNMEQNVVRNGEDDEAIHCFKKDGEIPEGVQLLKTRRAEREMEAIQEILGDIEIEEDDGEMNHAEEEDNNYDSDASIF
ncbi:unnamed protein product [Caenorhabditis nigoni]